MGIALIFGPIVGWVIVSIISIWILVFLFRTRPSYDLGKWAPGIVLGTVVVTSVLTPLVAGGIARAIADFLQHDHYGLVLALAVHVTALLLLPFCLGILFSESSKRVQGTIFAAALHQAAKGALIALLVYPITVPIFYSPFYKVIET